eukprot:476290_1
MDDYNQFSLMIAPFVNKTVTTNAEGKRLKYQSNLDDHGLFYALGTNSHKNKYSNPEKEGKLSIVVSKDLEKQKHCLVDRSRTNFVIQGQSKNDPPFFYINIGEYGLKPTRYTLRSSDKDNGYLTNWLLLASNDGVEWVTLKEHVNDTTLKKEGPFDAAKWDINAKDDGTYYSYFKVLMNGTNNDGHWKFGCCGFELYGHLITGDAFQYVYGPMTLFKSYTYFPKVFQRRLDSALPAKIDDKINANKFELYSRSAIIVQKHASIHSELKDDLSISLISDTSVLNYGDIVSHVGGSISIKCKAFKNFGRIQSKNNGRITIQCHSFENDSEINPKPTIIIPWQYLALDAKQRYIQLDLNDVNHIGDTAREDLRAAA